MYPQTEKQKNDYLLRHLTNFQRCYTALVATNMGSALEQGHYGVKWFKLENSNALKKDIENAFIANFTLDDKLTKIIKESIIAQIDFWRETKGLVSENTNYSDYKNIRGGVENLLLIWAGDIVIDATDGLSEL